VTQGFGIAGALVSSINKAVQTGEVKSEWEIIFDLGKRIRPENWPWNSVEEMFTEWLLKPSLGITFEDYRKNGWVYIPYDYYKYAAGTLRPDGLPGFMTPSGKVELSSSIFEVYGEDPLPYYEEPPFSPVSTPELMEKYPLILTSGARSFAYFHSEGRQIGVLRETHPEPLVEINPQTAAKLGIKDGEWVTIENMYGKCRQKAKVTGGIHPQVVHCQHGWWFPEKRAPNHPCSMSMNRISIC
jgi:anaerobic selenocysteine-containing dehydrogenase